MASIWWESGDVYGFTAFSLNAATVWLGRIITGYGKGRKIYIIDITLLCSLLYITDGFLQNTHTECSTALFVMYMKVYIDGLVQDCSISIANALEILATGDTAVLNQTINMPLLPSHLNAAGVWTGTVIIQGMKRLGKSRSGISSYTAVRVQHCQFSLKYSAPWNVNIVCNELFSMKAKMCTDKVKATFK